MWSRGVKNKRDAIWEKQITTLIWEEKKVISLSLSLLYSIYHEMQSGGTGLDGGGASRRTLRTWCERFSPTSCPPSSLLSLNKNISMNQNNISFVCLYFGATRYSRFVGSIATSRSWRTSSASRTYAASMSHPCVCKCRRVSATTSGVIKSTIELIEWKNIRKVIK